MPQLSQLPDLLLQRIPLHSFILDKIEAHGDRVALIDSTNPTERLSFRDVVKQSHCIATALHKRGIQKTDITAVLLPNCIQYPVIHFGVWLRGSSSTSINPFYTEYELEYLFADCKPRFVFTTDVLLPKVLKVQQKLKTTFEIVVLREKREQLPKGVVDYNSLLSTEPCYNLPPVNVYPTTDLVWLPYSSGTTGLPKGVMLSHYGMTTCLITWNNRSFFLCPSERETLIAYLPLFHVFGFATFLFGLMNGSQTVVMSRFQLAPFLQTIQDYKVRLLNLVPPTLVMLAKERIVSNYDLSSLRTIYVGAAPVGKELSEAVLGRHPNIEFLLQLYGATEVGLMTCMKALSRDQIPQGSCGTLLSNVESKVIDVSTGKELGVNERGELCIHSPAVMMRYLNKPEATAATIDKEGWLHTGDIVYYDEDGYYYVVDRLKEFIKVKGFQVAPAELEDLLLSHADVLDAAVIGVPDDTAGELPRAYVVRKAGSALTATDINSFIHDKVVAYKRLMGGVEFVDKLPKSPSGKILRRQLRMLYVDGTEENKSKI